MDRPVGVEREPRADDRDGEEEPGDGGWSALTTVRYAIVPAHASRPCPSRLAPAIESAHAHRPLARRPPRRPLAAPARAADDWTPAAWADENTVDLRTTEPGSEPYWFPVWLAVIDGQLYVRLGSRAAGRFDRNATKPIVGVRIAGKTFERVRGVLAPEMTDRVTAAMRDKYWTRATSSCGT